VKKETYAKKHLPPGPWQEEDDKITWITSSGLEGAAIRHPELGHWCGYIRVEKEHPWWGHRTHDDVDVPGGITYADHHLPDPDEMNQPDLFNGWWVGFGCAHGCHQIPGLGKPYGRYVTRSQVIQYVEDLARQASEATEE